METQCDTIPRVINISITCFERDTIIFVFSFSVFGLGQLYLVLPLTRNTMPKQATTPPFRNVDPTRTAEAFQFDDMSSINHSIVDINEEESRRVRSERSHVDNSTAIRSGSNLSNSGWEDHQRAVRRKNIFIR